MVDGTDQAEAFRARDRAAFDRDLPDALGVIADLEDAAAAQCDALGLGCVRFQMSWHLRCAQGLAAFVASVAPPVPDEPRPPLSGDPTRPREVKGGPQLQRFASSGSYHGLHRDGRRLTAGQPHP